MTAAHKNANLIQIMNFSRTIELKDQTEIDFRSFCGLFCIG